MIRMLNKKFGKLASDNKIEYAPVVIDTPEAQICNPSAQMYLDYGYSVIDNTPPQEVGAYFTPTEYGDLQIIDGVSTIIRRFERHGIPAPVVTYKVEEIIYGLIENEALQPVKQLVGDYWELFTMRDVITEDNEIWQEKWPVLKAAIIDAGILTEEQIEQILKDAVV